MPAAYIGNRSVSPTESLLPTGLPLPSLNDSFQQLPRNKKRSHGKSRPPGHIPRPPNAFICFRTDYIKAMEIQNSTPEVSKNVGELWRSMTDEERAPWIEMARVKKLEHQIKYPNYKYKPIHPRDENGNCIRKTRKPRAPKVPRNDFPDDLSTSYPVNDYPYPFSAAPSPPPISPPPSPVLNQFYRRRSSSVPAVLSPDPQFLYRPAMPGADACVNVARQSSIVKRPSTSMDFMCAGPNTAFADAYNHAQIMAQAGAPQSHWRMNHRRSTSAPGLGEMNELTFDQTVEFNHINPLTPINPVFGSVFERFAWPQSPNSSFNLADFTANVRRGSQLTLKIPKTPPLSSAVPSTSSSSAVSTIFSSLETPPLAISGRKGKPQILQPTPVSKFDVNAFEAHVKDLESFTGTLRVEDPFTRSDNLGFDGLGFSEPDSWSADSQDSAIAYPPTKTAEIQPTNALKFNELIVDNY